MERMDLQKEKGVGNKDLLEKVRTSYDKFFSKIVDTTSDEFKQSLPYNVDAPRLIQFKEIAIGSRRDNGRSKDVCDEEILNRFNEGMMLKPLSQNDNMVKAMIPSSIREGKILYEYTNCPNYPIVVIFTPVTLEVAVNMLNEGKQLNIADFRLLCMMGEPTVDALVKIEEFLDTEEFTKAQLKQIEQGISEGLGTKVYTYAKKHFNEEQMNIIRGTLVEGLESVWIVNPRLSANRMLIIQQALRLKLSVGILLSEKVTDKQAQAMFEGLVAGVSDSELKPSEMGKLSAKQIEEYVNSKCQ